MLYKITREVRYLFEGLLAALPYSVTGNFLRGYYWGRRLKIQDRGITIFPGVRFFSAGSIKIGGGKH